MIRLQEVNKSFGKHHVLRDISLEIPKGQATGIVGPNGSGKTTMIKTILGLVKPDSGTITVGDVKLNGNFSYRKLIGYMPQLARYPENMRVQELFAFIKKLRDNEASNEDELIEYFGLGSELDKPLRVLSGGYRQKVGASLALMFDPEILILDEPTAGLDPKSSFMFKEIVKKRKEAGKTVLLTSHIMSEIEELTDHLVFLLEGQVRYDGPMKELIKDSKEERLEGAIARMMEGEAA